MPERTMRIIMNGVTGRMGYRQHLLRSLLATMKAGAAYLPMEPSVPGSRIATFIKETGCETVIAHDRDLHRLPDSEPQDGERNEGKGGHGALDLHEAVNGCLADARQPRDQGKRQADRHPDAEPEIGPFRRGQEVVRQECRWSASLPLC